MMPCRVVLRTASPTPREGNSASAETPELKKRTPRKGYPSRCFNVIPIPCSASRPSGISPSPQVLSIGAALASATITRKPHCRAAIAAARPAGPPPITNTSVDFNKTETSPPQKQKLRTESRSHCREQAQRAGLGTTVPHHIFEHYEH